MKQYNQYSLIIMGAVLSVGIVIGGYFISQVKSLVEHEWQKVFEVNRNLIKDTNKFGFAQVGIISAR